MDKPIIFSGPMVRALLDGSKTMTRRLLYTKRKTRNGLVPASASMLRDHPPPCGELGAEGFPTDIAVDEYWTLSPWERVKPGARLWVRETCVNETHVQTWKKRWLREADKSPCSTFSTRERPGLRAAMHMPRKDSRLTLIITAMKIERLQEISKEDAIAEGVEHAGTLNGKPWMVWRDYNQEVYDPFEWFGNPTDSFCSLWMSLHGTGSWDTNHEVIAITFTVHQQNIDALARPVAMGGEA